MADVKTWTIMSGDGFHFTIVPAKKWDSPHSDEFLNGTYPTRLAAVERVIEGMEETRQALNKQIARAKQMRARLRRNAEPPTSRTPA